jgi:hypothetical protein
MQFGQLQTVGQALRREALKLMSQLDTTATASTGDSTGASGSSTNGGSNGTNGKEEVRSVWHIDPAQLRYVHAHWYTAIMRRCTYKQSTMQLIARLIVYCVVRAACACAQWLVSVLRA